MTLQRSRFTPVPCSQDTEGSLCDESKERQTWVGLVECAVDFPVHFFETALFQLIHHPEYNSTLILRSEEVSDTDSHDVAFPDSVPRLGGYHLVRCIRRKLLPRRPGRDAPVEQWCSFYTRGEEGEQKEDDDTPPVPVVEVVILTPITESGSTLPYYHPAVHHLAFRYISNNTSSKVRIEAQPLPDTPTSPSSRLFRTCLALLDTVHRYGWGAQTNYQKRVLHDRLVAREPYQDLYLVMRERHKHLVATWCEATDPLKHVFEDIGIATYLMLLWKETYSNTSMDATVTQGEILEDCGRTTERIDNYHSEPWRSWPRPPGGFLDFGCGNGLLTHILISEGYEGHGIDVRERTSWSRYPPETQTRLHVHAFNPLSLLLSDGGPGLNSESDPNLEPHANVNLEHWIGHDPYIKRGVFVIGNHADELTPWVPVVSTLVGTSGYLSIPCCAWTFDAKYDRSTAPKFSPVASPTSSSGTHTKHEEQVFIDSLNLGGLGNNESSYSMYRIWLATLSLHCGWEVECECLRIPSTRNWAIIGRKRTFATTTVQGGEEVVRGNARQIVERVRERGVFKPRIPEGKGIHKGGH
ncbi:hypothetical protein AMATHDRAFT_63347 [Amanita thiersii Skay4041]|uniref:tRNA (uracil-O(2)-)-methyltransferase n=1 Tax=Amanita thiersii Skay4041 TaxID=703135 RepID=A0A2A9NFJ3_9AGAR|nr:hypothetical protein AMATHDRAFT_63347 [Amanita thiersii Skay4041]